ncbi:hypothetical protein [Anabaena subtropica]|uniref:Uncharacterized protein n=1 Tax=Anabaena subtropica FACHB-260 TaxID=2692884 RepID=A0ABR8CXL9_9NOST|nr:hypothetical protein [Anabaena subtropica]MBD2347008.1 hypothetical protein [Anabaena subtropica FACHB-260]
MKQFLVLWQFFNQPLFAPTTVFNPVKFLHNYQIRQRLERCWMYDSVQLLERCWHLKPLFSQTD